MNENRAQIKIKNHSTVDIYMTNFLLEDDLFGMFYIKKRLFFYLIDSIKLIIPKM